MLMKLKLLIKFGVKGGMGVNLYFMVFGTKWYKHGMGRAGLDAVNIG